MIVLLEEKKERWAFGDGDMSTIADDDPKYVFGLEAEFFVLLSFMAWAEGGTGNADLVLYQKIRRDPTGRKDKGRRWFPKFGVSGTGFRVFYDERIQKDDDRHWILRGPNKGGAGDLWVPVWTNPDSGTMTWAVRCEMAPVIFEGARSDVRSDL